jgi:hypothetical protein
MRPEHGPAKRNQSKNGNSTTKVAKNTKFIS